MPIAQNPDYLAEHGDSQFLKGCIEQVTQQFHQNWRNPKHVRPYVWKVPANGLPRAGDAAEKFVLERLASDKLVGYIKEPIYIIR